MARRLNIVYLNSHDTGRYIQPYGHAVPTPNLQRFAEQGVLFRRAFCNAPTCSPSRAALLTGMHAHQCGMLGLAHRGFQLKNPDHHLARHLHAHGYRTAQCGINHVGDIGYDDQLPNGDGRERTDNVCRWLRDLAPDAGPFYLEVGFNETHRTAGKQLQWHNGPESPAGDPRYVRVPDPLPDTPQTRADFADYVVAAERLDGFYGDILSALDDAGHADDTLVIITTDHGIAFPGMKCSLTDHGTGVLMMLRGPDPATCGGKVVDALVQHLDVFPTVCAAAGVETPERLEGRSLLPLCAGAVGSLHEELFAEVTYHAAYEPKRSVRTDRWKYIRRFDDQHTTQVLPNVDPSPTKDVLIDAGWSETSLPSEQLFDLQLDPNEANNLADRGTHEPVLTDMRARLDAWMQRTGDPLLQGPVPLPPGATCNPRSGRQPTEEPTVYPEGGAAL